MDNFKTLISPSSFLHLHQMIKRSFRAVERSPGKVIGVTRAGVNLGTFTSNLHALGRIPWLLRDPTLSSLKWRQEYCSDLQDGSED